MWEVWISTAAGAASEAITAKNVRVCKRTTWLRYTPAVKAADVVVLASPLYYWNMSGQLRTAIDRLFALEEGDGNFLRGNGKSSVLLMAAEGNGFDDVVLYYDHLLEHLRWKNLGHVLSGKNMNVGDIKGKKELNEAYEMGKAIN